MTCLFEISFVFLESDKTKLKIELNSFVVQTFSIFEERARSAEGAFNSPTQPLHGSTKPFVLSVFMLFLVF